MLFADKETLYCVTCFIVKIGGCSLVVFLWLLVCSNVIVLANCVGGLWIVVGVNGEKKKKKLK